MKQHSIDILQLLTKSRRLPVNRNDRFWMDAVEFLGSISKSKGYPDFLVSWAKEITNCLKDPEVNIFLVTPLDGCWGIYIEGMDRYIFSYNAGYNIYISGRLYKYLKENRAHDLLAGLLIHEVSEFIMRIKTEKKGGTVDVAKNHGEAMRLEKSLVGHGLQNLFMKLVTQEMDRKKVTLDKQDLFVEGCAISGEEIVTEISSIHSTGESFILQLAPGQKKTLPYSGGNFTVHAEDFSDPFRLEPIDFRDYCRLMRIMDDFFIEEVVINGDGFFKRFLDFVRGLDFSNEHDNYLLRILWLFTQRFYNNEIPRWEFLYNMFLLADEYISYFIMRDIVKRYWKDGKFVRDNVEEIMEEVYKKKPELSPKGLEDFLVGWFSKMDSTPRFSKIENVGWVTQIPYNITRSYKKVTAPSILSNYEKDIHTELALHEEVLKILRTIRILMNEPRAYRGIKKGEDPRIYELGLIRVHFWKDKNIFTRDQTVGIYSHCNKWHGVADVIDVKEHSIVVFLKDMDVTIPEVGYIKRLQEEDLSINVCLEAIHKVKGKHIPIALTCSPNEHVGGGKGRERKSFFNPMINSDLSQCEAVERGLSSENLTLIQGPPGTGKTTVIAEIILQFLKLGKKVLLSSQTNSAVDNALMGVMKWRDENMGVGRVASSEEKIVDPGIKDIWIRSNRQIQEFEMRYRNGYVIGATNVGTHTLSVMRGKIFDVLVMDEAGKSNLVESILPMLLVKEDGKIIIVGDHKQGIPFAYDEDVIDLFIKKEIELHKRLKISKEMGYLIKEKLNQSLFERLIESGWKGILLRINYRSNPHIVELVSNLFYNGHLIPAKKNHGNGKGVIIVDTSRRASITQRKETEVIVEGESKGYKNPYEAQLVVEELKELLKYRYITTGIRSRQITGVTILAPYIFQVEEIRKQISQGFSRYLPTSALDELINNVTTIDSFQGREDEIVIISFTRSNENPSEVGFLSELNRINVALSRAKKKMILIGDFQTLINARGGPNAGFFRNIFKTIYETSARG